EVRGRALSGILPPVLHRDDDARDDQTQEKRDKKIFPRPEHVVIGGVPDQEIPEVGKWIRHNCLPTMDGLSNVSAQWSSFAILRPITMMCVGVCCTHPARHRKPCISADELGLAKPHRSAALSAVIFERSPALECPALERSCLPFSTTRTLSLRRSS